MQHFANLCGESPIPVAHLDALVPVLLLATSEVPFYAATVARARLSRLNERLTSALSGSALPSVPAPSRKHLPPTPKSQPAMTAGSAGKAASVSASTAVALESPWPGPRALLQLKLFATLFPTSDRRHPVLTPAALYVGRALSQSAAASDAGEAVRGLVLAGLALSFAGPAKRHFPEAAAFLADLIESFVSSGSAGAAAGAVQSGRLRRTVTPGLMAFEEKGKALAKISPCAVSCDKTVLPVLNALSHCCTIWLWDDEQSLHCCLPNDR